MDSCLLEDSGKGALMESNLRFTTAWYPSGAVSPYPSCAVQFQEQIIAGHYALRCPLQLSYNAAAYGWHVGLREVRELARLCDDDWLWCGTPCHAALRAKNFQRGHIELPSLFFLFSSRLVDQLRP